MKAFYLDEIEASSLSVNEQGESGDQYAIIATDATHEVDIGITALSEAYVDITIQLVESQ